MSDRSKPADKKRSQFWRYHIDTWSKSGLAQNAYCRENNLKPNRLTYWKNKFKAQNLPVEFIQVPQVKIATSTNPQFRDVLRLNVDSGFQIEVPDGFSQTTLTQVLEVLRGI
ncbi:MAG: IS66 family insertion sequence element accessory protein TnpB [Pseudomonadota bacterium]